MADHALRASGYALYGTAVYGAEQYGGHVRSETEVDSPTQIITVNFVAVSVETAASEVNTPTLRKSYELLSTSTETSSEVTTSGIDQVHNLASVDVETGTSEVTAPDLNQQHLLSASSIQSLSATSVPGLDQLHILDANDVSSSSETDIAALVVKVLFTSVSTESSSEPSVPLANEWRFFEQDTDRTTYVPEAIHIVSIEQRDVNRTAYVLGVSQVVYVEPGDVDFTVHAPEVNTQIRIAA